MQLIKLEKVSSGKYMNRYNATYINLDGQEKVYELVSRDSNLTMETFGNTNKPLDAVGIIVFNKDRSKVLLQREYRLACNNWVYNVPGGLIEPGETMEEAAARELREETGLSLIEVIDTMNASWSAVGYTDEKIGTVICIAEGEFKESDSPDEEIKPAWYSKELVRELLKTEIMSMRTQTLLYCWVNGI